MENILIIYSSNNSVNTPGNFIDFKVASVYSDLVTKPKTLYLYFTILYVIICTVCSITNQLFNKREARNNKR